MELYVLGSGTALPMPHRNPPAFLVQTSHTRLLMDCGSGAVNRLARLSIHPRLLDAIFISHAHIDHMADLLPLVFSFQLPGCELTEDLVLHVGPGFSKLWHSLEQTFDPYLFPKGPQKIQLVEHKDAFFKVKDLECWVKPLDHHPTSIGIRIRDNTLGTLAYLGDTDLCDEAIELCRDVDLAVIECSVPDEYALKGHLNPAKIATLVQKAHPKHVLLTHMYVPVSEYNPIQALRTHGCSIPLSIAEDGMAIEIA